MSASLKPCPFCGGEVKLWIQCEDDENKGEELGVVGCPRCGITQCVADTLADAVAQWNTREGRTCWRVGTDIDGISQCSECDALLGKFARYCPNCGAKVAQEDDEG